MMEYYSGDRSVEEELAFVPTTVDSWAKQYRVSDFGEEVEDVLNGWWYKACCSFLPHLVDEVLQFNNTRSFLFAGAEGTGRYTTAKALARKLSNSGYICYDLPGSAFDVWKGDRMEAAVQALAIGDAGSDSETEGETEGRTVVIRFPEECKRPKKLQLALLSVLEYCTEMDLPLFLFVITQNPQGLNSRLRRVLHPCVFRLPDEEDRRRFFRSYFEERGFRFDQNGNAAIEKERRENMVRMTEGFNYDQLHRIWTMVLVGIKGQTLEKCVYVPEDTIEALQRMDFLFMQPEDLKDIVDRIRDEESILLKADTPVVLTAVQNAGVTAAADAVSAGNTSGLQQAPWDSGVVKSGEKKKQVSLAEMYRTITMELG